MKHWFSSDWHLGHHNILKYDARPFDTIEEHDETIIRNFNEKVRKGDNFYFLGDFAFNTKKSQLVKYFESISNGANLFFIKGNHDHRDTRKLYEKYGTYLGQLDDIKIQEKKIVLCHYAMEIWNESHHLSWHLHGHSHHSLPDNRNKLRIDVGVNGRKYNYSPLEYEEIEMMMVERAFKAIDHHGKEYRSKEYK